MENVFPLPVAAWSAELMWSNPNATDNPDYMPLVWVLRHREGKLEEQRVYSPMGKTCIPEETARRIAAERLAPALEFAGMTVVADENVQSGIAEYRDGRICAMNPADYAKAKAELEKRAKFAEAVEKAWAAEDAPCGPDDAEVSHAKAEAAERIRLFARYQMVNTIIAEQVAAGGVDTEGTRAQAERWCAMLAGCVCEGMRATTEQSALRLARKDVAPRWFPRERVTALGKPLGRP